MPEQNNFNYEALVEDGTLTAITVPEGEEWDDVKKIKESIRATKEAEISKFKENLPLGAKIQLDIHDKKVDGEAYAKLANTKANLESIDENSDNAAYLEHVYAQLSGEQDADIVKATVTKLAEKGSLSERIKELKEAKIVSTETGITELTAAQNKVVEEAVAKYNAGTVSFEDAVTKAETMFKVPLDEEMKAKLIAAAKAQKTTGNSKDIKALSKYDEFVANPTNKAKLVYLLESGALDSLDLSAAKKEEKSNTQTSTTSDTEAPLSTSELIAALKIK